nr:chromosome partitioning protein ParA [Acetobacter persici]
MTMKSPKLKAKRLDDITSAENLERERVRAEIARELEAWTNQQDDVRKRLNGERTEFERQKGALSALQSEVEGRKVELESAERMLERQEQRLEQKWQRRDGQIRDEVEEQLEERRKSMETTEANCKAENARLREALGVQTEILGAFEQLKRQLGGKDPAEILRALNSQTDELKRLREELASRPTEEMRVRYMALESEAMHHKTRADALELQRASDAAAIAEVGDLRRQNSEFNAENRSLAHRASIFEGAANEAQAELNRLRAAYERPAEVEARYEEIEMPYISADKAKPPVKSEIDEKAWLAGIGNACDTYGLHFNPRILKAFHTALKTAEWSPLTVLAGVSGTGKSELPRLYSHFGGIYFEPLSVQPNWDSQESMLGFFNSIDNKFDAQPVLRFLAQSQKPWSNDYPGLQDAVCLVLLDEMNLAHPELYFAEFLSKLELRRGRRGNDVPSIPVKIGAGMKPYELPLGRNVLWVGTMNQDETTKSLSDKVLDRSIIINFPRPTELKRRRKLAPLDDANRGTALHKTLWQGWLALSSDFSDDQINPFRTFIEGINASLAVTGRALGHRVWQSIEYYMANYPDVCAARQTSDRDALAKAMHVAFEDQLVQKVMPKLRGIDTRGKSKTECLDKIRGQIITGIGGNSFNLGGDFDLACDLGYGQFIWQSANYLNLDDTCN